MTMTRCGTTARRRQTAARLLLVGIAVVGLAGLAGCSAPEPGPWAGWRGPGSQGISPDTGLPVSWSEGDASIAWRVETTPGNSSPIVNGDRIYLTGMRTGEGTGGQPHRLAQARDFATGELIWETILQEGRPGHMHRNNTPAAPTPVTDGHHLYVYLASHLAALDLDGQIVWQQEINPDAVEMSHYGASSSPVLTSSAVIVLQDREESEGIGWLGAFSKDDGAELWRVEWETTCCSYSTPLVVDRGGGEEVIVALSRVLQSFDAATGELLWEAKYVINQLVASPLLEDDLLIVSGGAHQVRESVAFRLTGSHRDTRVEELWSDAHAAPQVSSPVLYQGLLFAVTTPGVAWCRDPVNGKLLWQERLPAGGIYASMVAGDGKVYIFTRQGLGLVFAASREFELLGENLLEEFGGGKVGASPAIAHGAILLRGEESLYKIVTPVEDN